MPVVIARTGFSRWRRVLKGNADDVQIAQQEDAVRVQLVDRLGRFRDAERAVIISQPLAAVAMIATSSAKIMAAPAGSS